MACTACRERLRPRTGVVRNNARRRTFWRILSRRAARMGGPGTFETVFAVRVQRVRSGDHGPIWFPRRASNRPAHRLRSPAADGGLRQSHFRPEAKRDVASRRKRPPFMNGPAALRLPREREPHPRRRRSEPRLPRDIRENLTVLGDFQRHTVCRRQADETVGRRGNPPNRHVTRNPTSNWRRILMTSLTRILAATADGSLEANYSLSQILG